MIHPDQHIFKRLRELNEDRELVESNLIQLGIIKSHTDRMNVFKTLKHHAFKAEALCIKQDVEKMQSRLLKLKARLGLKVTILKQNLKEKGYANI